MNDLQCFYGIKCPILCASIKTTLARNHLKRLFHQYLSLAILLSLAQLFLTPLHAAEQNEAPALRQAPPQILSLDQTKTFAINQNRDIRRAVLEVSKTEAALRAVITTRYPQLLALTYMGEQANRPHDAQGAVLPAVLEPFTQQYRIDLQVKDATLAVKIAREQLRLTRQRTVAEVLNDYLTVVALKSAIASREQDLQFLRQLEQYVAAEVQRGAALPVDLLVVQAKVAKADYEYDRDQDDIITLGQTLNRLLGRSLKTPFDVVETPLITSTDLDEEAAIARALAQRPELRQAKMTVGQFHLREKIEISRYLPDISVGMLGTFSHNLDITLPRRLVGFGLVGSWEPWDWGRRIQLSRVSERQMRQSIVALSDLSDSVSVETDNARRAMKVSIKEVQAGSLGESSAKEELRVAFKRYTAGSELLQKVMDAQAAYSKAIADNVAAKIHYASTQVAFDKALGRDY